MGAFGTSEIPLLLAASATDCGPACVAMVLGHFGRHVTVEDIAKEANAGAGTDAATLVRVARFHGLIAQGVKAELEEIDQLPPASILHWEFNHYVVLERVLRTAVQVVDPLVGRRKIPMTEFRRSFTGVALVFEPSETFEPLRGKRPLWRYVRDALSDGHFWIQIIATSLLAQAFTLCLPFFAGLVIDRVVPHQDSRLLVTLGAGIACVVVFDFAGMAARGHLLVYLRAKLDARLTTRLIDHALELPLDYFESRTASNLVARFRSPAVIRDTLTSTALSGLLDGLLVFVYTAVLFAVDATVGALVLALGIGAVFLFYTARLKLRGLATEELYRSDKSFQSLVELLFGVETLKSMGLEGPAVGEHLGKHGRQINATIARDRLQITLDAAMGAFRLGCPLLVLGFGTWRAMRGELSVGTVLTLATLASGFFYPLANLFTTGLSLESIDQHVRHVEEVLTSKPEQNPEGRRPAPKLGGGVELREVTFHYAGLNAFGVESCSVCVAPGQFVAVVGPSGSGKSTLAKLLAGLYSPSSGSVLFDGMDLRELDLTSVRRQIGVVSQRPAFFTASIRKILTGNEPGVSLSDIEDACRRACIYDDIATLPLGFETLLSSEGGRLSGGQRQRIALARALVRRPVLLLLDEATSALDVVTEAAVQAELQKLSCTRIVVAHRLSTVIAADKIVVVQAGRIAEQGTHSGLLELRGAYHALVAGQLA